jgi:hypothetical protein
MQARDVVFVMLDRIERDSLREIGQAGVNAALLIDRHLIFLEIEIGDPLFEHTDHEVVRELVLIAKSRSCDRLHSLETLPIRLLPLQNRFERVIVQPIVVAIIPEGGGSLGEVAEVGLILRVEQSVLFGYALRNRLDGLGKTRDVQANEEEGAKECAHGFVG